MYAYIYVCVCVQDFVSVIAALKFCQICAEVILRYKTHPGANYFYLVSSRQTCRHILGHMIHIATTYFLTSIPHTS